VRWTGSDRNASVPVMQRIQRRLAFADVDFIFALV
jgi:hypothetical protein